MQRVAHSCFLTPNEIKFLRTWLTDIESITEYQLTARIILRNSIQVLNEKLTRGTILDLFCRSMILDIDKLEFEYIKLSYEIFVL
jgi:hypothetical protein